MGGWVGGGSTSRVRCDGPLGQYTGRAVASGWLVEWTWLMSLSLSPPCADSKVRFILMNSFSTSADTKAYLRKAHGGEAWVSSKVLESALPLGC